MKHVHIPEVGLTRRPSRGLYLGKDLLLAVLLCGLICAAYWPSLFLGWFPLDDATFIGGNPALTSPSGWQTIWLIPRLNPHYYPLLLSVYRLLLQSFGLDPLPFHVANLLCHSVAVFFLWRLLGFLGFRLAWFAAAAWALHPLNVQTVAWVTEMKNTLSTAFYFAALLCLARGWNAAAVGRWWSASFVLFLAAMLSKSTSVSFLAAVILVAWGARWHWSRRHVLALLPFALFGVLFALFSWGLEKGFSAQTPGRAFTLAECFVSSGKGLFFYLSKVFWPFDLTFIYRRFDLTTQNFSNFVPLLLWAVGLASLFFFSRFLRVGRWPAAAMAFYTLVVGSLPFVGIAFVRVFSDVTDHFVYLPIAAPIALCVCGLGCLRLFSQAAFAQILAGLLVAVCFFLTRHQSEIFGTAEFWRRAMTSVPEVGPHYGWYASRLIEEGRIEEGKSIALAALAKRPDLQSALFAAGMAGSRGNTPREALPYLRKLAELSGGTMPEPVRRSLYANGLLRAGEPRQAAQILEDLRIKQMLPLLGYLDLARCYLELGMRQQALIIYNEALRLDPRGTRANEQMAVALAEVGSLDAALERARVAVASAPRSVSARVNLAKMLSAAGDHASALSLIAIVRQETPEDTQLRVEEANLLQAAGQEKMAADEFEAVLRTDASNIDAANNLAWIFVSSSDRALRNTERAVELAKSAVASARKDQRKDVLHFCLGTLSRALKSAGRMGEAKSAALEADEAAKQVGDESFREGLRRDGLLPPD